MRFRRPSVLVLLCSIAIILSAPTNARAQLGFYTFQGLADTRTPGPFSDFGFPVINTAGDVAFAARLRTGGSGIYKFDAAQGVIVTIFEDPTNDLFFFPGFAAPAIDDAGRVIFQYDHDTIVAGSGGALSPVADQSFTIPLGSSAGPFACQQPRLRSRSADAAGRVVIHCSVSAAGGFSGVGIYLGGGGTLQRICDGGMGPPPFTNIFDRCFADGPIEVSPLGVLAGIGVDGDLRDPGGTPRQLLVRGDATNLEILLDPGVDSALAFPTTLSQLGINLAGTVTYSAFQNTPPGSGRAIYRIDVAGVPVNVTDPRNFAYREANWPSINTVGELPFVDAIRGGLFMGPDPVLNKIIVRGDEIPGYEVPGVITTIAAISFQHPGINTLGELTFVAHLGDGTLVIARAIPPTNHPPDVQPIGDQTTAVGSLGSVQVVASDRDGDYPLTYSTAAPIPLPPGTIGGLPPGITNIDANGLITGIPDASAEGKTYAVMVTVRDTRTLATSVSFLWTITQPLPPARTNLTATANPNPLDPSIDLAWENPDPDPVDRIPVSVSFTGPGGPFVVWQTDAPDLTSFRFQTTGGIGQFCFVVNGVIDGPPSVASPNSNVACAIYPRNDITNFTQLQAGVDTVTFSFSTAMPSTVTIPDLPAGASATISGGPATSFQVTVIGLPTPSTTYQITLSARSVDWQIPGTRRAEIVTAAAPPPPPPGQIPGAAARRQGPLLVTIVQQPTYVAEGPSWGYTLMVVEVTNMRGGRAQDITGLRVLPDTSLEHPCIEWLGCEDGQPVRDRVMTSEPALVNLAVGDSVQFTLHFPRAFARPGGFFGGSRTGTLSLFLDYGGSVVHDPFELSVILPGLQSGVGLTIQRWDPRLGRLSFFVSNDGGPGAAVGVSLNLEADQPVAIGTLYFYLNGSLQTLENCTPPRVSRQRRCDVPDIAPDERYQVFTDVFLNETGLRITVSSRTPDDWQDDNVLEIPMTPP